MNFIFGLVGTGITTIILWTNDGCLDGAPEEHYTRMPISELLALPERKEE